MGDGGLCEPGGKLLSVSFVLLISRPDKWRHGRGAQIDAQYAPENESVDFEDVV
jgi:hypothetical protein